MTSLKQHQFGPLLCRLVERTVTDQPPDLAVILCHGYGAPGDDLVPIGFEILNALPRTARVQFLFPEAPIALDDNPFYAGRAWWPISVSKLVEAVERGQLDVIRKWSPPGLSEAREKLLQTIQVYCASQKLDFSKVVLGGFSQGAMITTDVALRSPVKPAGLTLFSGTLICEEEWQVLAKQKEKLDITMSHGKLDPILPFAMAEALRDLLVDNGHRVQFTEFSGVHTIPQTAMTSFTAQLKRLLS